MKRIPLLITLGLLLLSRLSLAQTASPTQFGVVKVGTNLSVDGNGKLGVTTSLIDQINQLQARLDSIKTVLGQTQVLDLTSLQLTKLKRGKGFPGNGEAILDTTTNQIKYTEKDFGYTLVRKADSSYQGTTFYTKLAFYGSFNETSGTTLTDRSGNGHNGANGSGVTQSATGYSYNGSGTTTLNGTAISATKITFYARFNQSSTGDFTLYNSAGGTGGLQIKTSGLTIQVNKSGMAGIFSTGNVFSLNQDVDLIVTYDMASGAYTAYVNGSLVASNTNAVSVATGGNDLVGNAGSREGFVGVIKREAVWNDRLFTAAEVNAFLTGPALYP